MKVINMSENKSFLKAAELKHAATKFTVACLLFLNNLILKIKSSTKYRFIKNSKKYTWQFVINGAGGC